MPITLFKDQADYTEFLIWMTEGSTLAMRMQGAWGVPEIPENWRAARKYLRDNNIEPETLPKELNFNAKEN